MDREVNDAKTLKRILRYSKHFVLSLADGGEPYAVPMGYVYDEKENVIYFHCANEGKKIEFIKKNPRAWGVVVVDQGIMEGACVNMYASAMFTGRVEFFEDASEKAKVMNLFAERLSSDTEGVKIRVKKLLGLAQLKQYPGQRLGDEKGMVLVVSLMMVAVIVLLGTTAVMTTSTDMKISANYKTGNQAFYVSEAGIEEARGRLRGMRPPPITDDTRHRPAWAAYIGAEAKASGKGYNSGNSMHSRYRKPSSTLDYTVKIVHATNAAAICSIGVIQTMTGCPTETPPRGKTSIGSPATARPRTRIR